MLNQFSVNEGNAGSGGGGVSSVGLTAIGQLQVTGSPVTTTGVMGITLQPFDPTSASTNYQLFDDLGGYQKTTNEGLLQFWAIINGTATLQRGTLNTGESNRLGVDAIGPGQAAGAYALYMCGVQHLLIGSNSQSFSCAAYYASLPTAANNYEVTHGFSDNWPTTNNGVRILFSASLGNWQAVCSKAGVVTQVDTGIAPIAGNWTNLRTEIVAGGSFAIFYVDGVIGATIATNLPTATIGPINQQRNLAGTTLPVTNRMDWLNWKYSFTSARGTF